MMSLWFTALLMGAAALWVYQQMLAKLEALMLWLRTAEYRRGLLDATYRIGSTHAEAIQWYGEASSNYDPTVEDHCYGVGCTIVSTGAKIPVAAEFTESKQTPEETAMLVTRDALAVALPVWMIGDSAYDILDWHDSCGQQEVVPVTQTTRETLTTRSIASTGSKTASTS